MSNEPMGLRDLITKYMSNQEDIIAKLAPEKSGFFSTNTKINIGIGALFSMFLLFGGYMLTIGQGYNKLQLTALQANERSIKLELDMREQQKKVAVIEEAQNGINKRLESIEGKLDKLIDRELSKH